MTNSVISKLLIRKSAYQELLKLAEKTEIVCGFLVGRKENNFVYVNEVRSVKTKSNWVIHFKPVFKHFRQIADQIHGEGKEIIGEFHTHPKGTSWPTRRDKKIMKQLSIGLWIISTPKEASAWLFDIWKMGDWVKENIKKIGIEVI